MSAAAPRAVTTNQHGISPRLKQLADRRDDQPFMRPIADRSTAVFERLAAWVAAAGRPLLLDSGCGTGASTLALAARHPDCVVVGIDKSAHRLARHGLKENLRLIGNAALGRADLLDIWRLAAAAGWRVQHHYLLYPNPWPKHRHLARRWHAHPVFPALLELGELIEVRSNWKLYLDEFAAAAAAHGAAPAQPEVFDTTAPLTPFETKYRGAGQRLYRLRLQPGATAGGGDAGPAG